MNDREDLRARVVYLDDRIRCRACDLITVHDEQVAVVRIDRYILRVVAAQMPEIEFSQLDGGIGRIDREKF